MFIYAGFDRTIDDFKQRMKDYGGKAGIFQYAACNYNTDQFKQQLKEYGGKAGMFEYAGSVNLL